MPRKKKEKAVADQNPPDKQQNPPQPAQQPAQQPQQQPAQAPPQHQQALAAAGLDWGRLQGLPWGQILALIEALIAAGRGKAPS